MSHRVLKEKVTRDRSMLEEINGWAVVAWQRFEQRFSKKNDKDEWESHKKRLESKKSAHMATAAQCNTKAMLVFGSESVE